MTTVLGQERATVTSASVPASITRWAMASVSSRASGVPTGTSARSRMAGTALAGTPSTRTVRAASTGLSSTSQMPATRTATTARPQAASSHGRRLTAAARAANREREEASPIGDRFAPASGRPASRPETLRRQVGRLGRLIRRSRAPGCRAPGRPSQPGRPGQSSSARSASRRRISGPTIVTSPAPTVITRSPGRARAATVGAAWDHDGT